MAKPNENKSWQAEVSELLTRAAELCVENEVAMDPFVRGACSAYIEANPEMAEQIAERQLLAQIEQLRQRGRMPSA
jgi:hypothetical protein